MTPVPAPVSPTPAATVRWRPLGQGAARITGGFWAARQHADAVTAIPDGQKRLEAAGNLGNLRLAAGEADGEPTVTHEPDLLGGVTVARMPGWVDRARERGVDLVAIPYHAWANRGVDAMRVWLPLG